MKNVYLSLVPLLLIFFNSAGQDVKSFENGDVILHYEEYGQGPALYILSGGPGESPDHPYRQIIDSLQSFYTCILLHQRGSGRSRDIPINNSTITIDNYTQDIELLRKHRGDKSISVFGMSWGGLLAMNYAALYPEFVSDLILVSSAPPTYSVWNVLYDNQFTRRSKSELDSMAMLQKIFSTKTEKQLDSLKMVRPASKEVIAFKDFISLHVRAMYYDNSKISKKNVETLFYNFNFQPIPLIDREVLETQWDITKKLKRLNTKALIVYGRQDDQGESTFYIQKESLKFSEMHVIEKCGHMIIDEQPAEFFKILIDYVSRKSNR